MNPSVELVMLLCASLCAAELFDVDPEVSLKTRVKRQAMIAPGAKNRCPNGYVSFNEKCIQCDKYLQESTNMLVPQECSNASGWNNQPHYSIYFLLILLTILNKINLLF